MTKKTKIAVGASLALAVAAMGAGQSLLQEPVTAQAGSMVSAPSFVVDPYWPKPLPNQWIIGRTIGIDIDDRDHVFIVHRDQDAMFGGATEIGLKMGVSDCCTPAPPILEFDPEGNLVNAWGGPGDNFTWPASNHGLAVAPNGNVWIGGNGGGDSHVLVFTGDGQFVAQYGMPGQEVDSNSMTHFGQVADIEIDGNTNEAYIADGYRNKRVAVLDASTGAFKRYWGAYGNRPEDVRVDYTPGEPLPQQFRGPVHCAVPSDDGLLYVCDRGSDRIQVFRPDGTFVREALIAPDTLAQGSTWDISFSNDAEQKFIYLADGQNFKIYVIDRESMEVLTSFGGGGRQPGQFYAPHSIASDSNNNIYTTETYEGKRVQKFVYQGMRDTQRGGHTGVPWPADRM
jgi:DNA-binding beta-propeller fold protein YncE